MAAASNNKSPASKAGKAPASKSSAAAKKPAANAKPAPKSAAKSGGSSAAKSSAKSGTKAAPAVRDPIRFRGFKAFLCLALAVFSFIGCFTKEGLFIWFFRRFMQGLIGKGFFILPVALLFCAAMLVYVQDRPLGWRISCTLLLTVTVGALIHLFGCKAEFAWDWKLPGALYDTGVLPGEAGSGGAIGGLLAIVFASLFNRTGAAIVLILATVFLLFTAVDVTVAALIERSREKAKLRAEEWKLMREEERRKAEDRRKTAEEALREKREDAYDDPFADFGLPRHPVTADSASPKPEPRSAKRRAQIDIDPLEELNRRPAEARTTPTAETPAPVRPAAAEVAEPVAPRQPVSIPKKNAKPVSDKDWLADILTKDRLRGGAQNSPSDRVVHTAIRPDPGAERTVRTGEVNTAQLPQEPLPEADELFRPVKAPSEPKAEAYRPAEPEPVRRSEPEYEEEKPAITPQLNPAAVHTSQQPRSAFTEEEKAEAAAVLAQEKAARAVEKAETVKAKAEMLANIEENLAGEAEAQTRPYAFPPLTLLTPGTVSDGREGLEEEATNARRLSDTIKSFGIPAEICNVVRGPTVTRYEVELEQGVKLNRLTNLADDIALALGASGVRIAPVPEKISTVGIEVPNKKTTTVYLRDILDTPAFREKAGALPFAVGKDIGGTPIVGDISKLPHLLIAGTTGSGKSVCMNSLILSLLYRCSPEDVRLIMIDPKMIELGIYNGIPHLLIPVVTDPKKAAGALQWAVMEMTKRNALLADAGARDLAGYNRLMEKEGGQKLPRMVILIDELADLMMTAAKDVEDSICRIAAVGRASGIHLVVATQRPSADVITGLMKANISSRIAFAVDSALNSRIILDTSGAEKLVGKGDMLYSPIGAGKPIRVQGTFVTDEEREGVIGFVKQQGEAEYDSGLQDEIEHSGEKDAKKPEAEEPDDGDGGELDELFNEAVEVVLDSKQASVSLLQRRLKLGYSRAARIVDQMEEQGVVGPFEGSKPRQVRLTREQWNAMRGIEGEPPVFTDYEEDAEEDDGVPEELL